MNKWVRLALIAVFCVVFLVCAFFVVRYFVITGAERRQFEELAELVEQATGDPDVPVEVTVPQTGETVHVLPKYAKLFELNSHLVGWLRIDGTDVDYPVMQTPDSPDYYLHRDFYGKYSYAGCLYAREQCDITLPSDNITIYGHNMKDGSMFADLLNYRSMDFWKSHRYITFETLTESHTYEIFAVFTTSALVGEGFAYHQFIQAATETDFYSYVRDCKALSLYDTGVSVSYGDKLITLSTCEYTQTEGRFVVVAKQVN